MTEQPPRCTTAIDPRRPGPASRWQSRAFAPGVAHEAAADRARRLARVGRGDPERVQQRRHGRAAGDRRGAREEARRAGGGDRDRVDAAPGESIEPYPSDSRSLPRCDHDDDARGDRALHRAHERVGRRVDLGAADREVDHVHAVGDGCVDGGDEVGGRADRAVLRIGLRQAAVVAEPGLRRDTREPAHLGPSELARRRHAEVAGEDARDVGAVARDAGVERQAIRAGCAGRRERAGDDHLAVRVGAVAAREAGRILQALRREERVVHVDAVVDHADLDACSAPGELGAPDGGRADHLGHGVRERVVGEVRVDGRDARHPSQRRDLVRPSSTETPSSTVR